MAKYTIEIIADDLEEVLDVLGTVLPLDTNIDGYGIYVPNLIIEREAEIEELG